MVWCFCCGLWLGHRTPSELAWYGRPGEDGDRWPGDGDGERTDGHVTVAGSPSASDGHGEAARPRGRARDAVAAAAARDSDSESGWRTDGPCLVPALQRPARPCTVVPMRSRQLSAGSALGQEGEGSSACLVLVARRSCVILCGKWQRTRTHSLTHSVARCPATACACVFWLSCSVAPYLHRNTNTLLLITIEIRGLIQAPYLHSFYGPRETGGMSPGRQ
jgi:hypothetical protein